jgi:hypothetical protein
MIGGAALTALGLARERPRCAETPHFDVAGR